MRKTETHRAQQLMYTAWRKTSPVRTMSLVWSKMRQSPTGALQEKQSREELQQGHRVSLGPFKGGPRPGEPSCLLLVLLRISALRGLGMGEELLEETEGPSCSTLYASMF